MSEPFSRSHLVNNPGIVGARWWQESLAIAGDPVARRAALISLSAVGVSLLGVGVVGSLVCAGSSGDDDKIEKREALAIQRDYGWNFGAEEVSLTFDGASTAAFDRASLAAMASALAPGQGGLKPHFVPTLFQATTAMPRLTIQGRTTPVKPLADALRPIYTTAMREAYRCGKALASLFDNTPSDRLVVVDMPGPEAVAFAAGAAERLEPVFVFDNWPHPLGVVPSHLTLAAAAYYQPLFVKARGSRKPNAPGLIVLDSNRLNAYTSESTQFDNRYVARLPSVESIKALGDKRILHVSPSASFKQEADDLNADYVAYKQAGFDVKMVAATDFRADPSTPSTAPANTSPDDWPPYYYGGDDASHFWFWKDYPWNPPQKPAKPAMGNSGLHGSYSPSARSTMFSGTGASKTRPASMGAVPVLVAAGTGVIVGSAVSRSGSLNRYSGSSGS